MSKSSSTKITFFWAFVSNLYWYSLPIFSIISKKSYFFIEFVFSLINSWIKSYIESFDKLINLYSFKASSNEIKGISSWLSLKSKVANKRYNSNMNSLSGSMSSINLIGLFKNFVTLSINELPKNISDECLWMYIDIFFWNNSWVNFLLVELKDISFQNASISSGSVISGNSINDINCFIVLFSTNLFLVKYSDIFGFNWFINSSSSDFISSILIDVIIFSFLLF